MSRCVTLLSGLLPQALTHDFIHQSLRWRWGRTLQGLRQDVAQPMQGILVLGQDLDPHEQAVNQYSFSCYLETMAIYTRASMFSCPQGHARRGLQAPLLHCFPFQSGPSAESLCSHLPAKPRFSLAPPSFERRVKQAVTY